jgi:hypothetical protein
MNTSTGEVAAIVTVLGVVLGGIGITGIDPSVLNGAVNGVVAIVTLVAAIVSWYQHRKANIQ